MDRAAIALDGWLRSELNETDEDWLPYLERLESRDIWLPGETELAERFAEHANEELDRWSPSPPNLRELIEYADRFELRELEETLRERERQDELEEELRERREPRRQVPGEPGLSPLIDDEGLREMFARLALGNPSDN